MAVLELFYTPTLRNNSMGTLWTGALPEVRDYGVLDIPPGRPAHFDNTLCVLVSRDPGVRYTVVSQNFHAHLLGRSMWAEKLDLGFGAAGGATLSVVGDVGRSPQWDFEHQLTVPFPRGQVTLRPGDVLSTTCVFDSTVRGDSCQTCSSSAATGAGRLAAHRGSACVPF